MRRERVWATDGSGRSASVLSSLWCVVSLRVVVGFLISRASNRALLTFIPPVRYFFAVAVSIPPAIF